MSDRVILMMTNAIATQAASLLTASGVTVLKTVRTGFRRDTGATFKLVVAADWIGKGRTTTVDRVRDLNGYDISHVEISKLTKLSEVGVC